MATRITSASTVEYCIEIATSSPVQILLCKILAGVEKPDRTVRSQPVNWKKKLDAVSARITRSGSSSRESIFSRGRARRPTPDPDLAPDPGLRSETRQTMENTADRDLEFLVLPHLLPRTLCHFRCMHFLGSSSVTTQRFLLGTHTALLNPYTCFDSFVSLGYTFMCSPLILVVIGHVKLL